MLNRSFRQSASRLSMLALLVLVGGCDIKGCRKDNSSGLPDSARLDDLASPTFGNTAIAGRITFDGAVPAPTPIGNAEFCGEVMSETVVVGDEDGLANVLVYLDGAPSSSGVDQPAALLDQDRCRFVPHVLAVQIGQPLNVVNGDPMRHNVHYKPARNEHVNLAFETGGMQKTVSFTVPEERPTTIKCDIHPWMTAYIGVFSHPFFAVTDERGRYEIARVPAGEYELVAWHEIFGEKREAIVVADVGAGAVGVTVDFLYARP